MTSRWPVMRMERRQAMSIVRNPKKDEIVKDILLVREVLNVNDKIFLRILLRISASIIARTGADPWEAVEFLINECEFFINVPSYQKKDKS